MSQSSVKIAGVIVACAARRGTRMLALVKESPKAGFYMPLPPPHGRVEEAVVGVLLALVCVYPGKR